MSITCGNPASLQPCEALRSTAGLSVWYSIIYAFLSLVQTLYMKPPEPLSVSIIHNVEQYATVVDSHKCKNAVMLMIIVRPPIPPNALPFPYLSLSYHVASHDPSVVIVTVT